MSDSDTNENPSTVQSLNMAQTKEEPEERKKTGPKNYRPVHLDICHQGAWDLDRTALAEATLR